MQEYIIVHQVCESLVQRSVITLGIINAYMNWHLAQTVIWSGTWQHKCLYEVTLRTNAYIEWQMT